MKLWHVEIRMSNREPVPGQRPGKDWLVTYAVLAPDGEQAQTLARAEATKGLPSEERRVLAVTAEEDPTGVISIGSRRVTQKSPHIWRGPIDQRQWVEP